ncbi:hypothetical protein, partial [Streptococcus agalactiae]|uniref:hypothetical protein n=1 Tax=Streptococcus agalactiae TaxID=1311 RepID=UPI003C7E4056
MVQFIQHHCFRAVLFRMVPKHRRSIGLLTVRFRAVLFRMVPKHPFLQESLKICFRAVLFRMVPKQRMSID